MEASLCGCAIVATDHKMGGTSDYAMNGKTCLSYPAGDVNSAVQCCKQIIEDDLLRYNLIINMNKILEQKICNRQTNMRRLIDYVSM